MRKAKLIIVFLLIMSSLFTMGFKKSLDKPLMNAVKSGDVKKVEELLKKGANPNAKKDKGFTVLIESIYDGNIDTVRLLIKYGADINKTSDDGFINATPLMLSISQGEFEIFRFLLSKKPDINIKNKMGETALDIAIRYGQKEMAEMLKAAGAKE